MDVRRAVHDHFAMHQEHLDPEQLLATLAVPPGAFADLTRLASRLAELNPGLSPAESVGMGLIQGFAIGVRAARDE